MHIFFNFNFVSYKTYGKTFLYVFQIFKIKAKKEILGLTLICKFQNFNIILLI